MCRVVTFGRSSRPVRDGCSAWFPNSISTSWLLRRGLSLRRPGPLMCSDQGRGRGERFGATAVVGLALGRGGFLERVSLGGVRLRQRGKVDLGVAATHHRRRELAQPLAGLVNEVVDRLVKEVLPPVGDLQARDGSDREGEVAVAVNVDR